MIVRIIPVAIVLVAACASPVRAQATFDTQTPGGVAGALPALGAGWLVSPEEALSYRGDDALEAPAPRRTRALAIAPVIEVVQPEPVSDLKVKAPFAIAVLFKSQPDTAINPGSFKVLYGAFKLDITSRITQYVTVTKDGFSLADAKIPTGKHRLILQVQDDKQRMAERELRLVVE